MKLFSDEYLAHHGILGQKWGVRRYQNKDGSLTSAGKQRKNLHKLFEEYEKKQEAAYPTMKKYVNDHKSDIAKQTGVRMANDVFRWREECRNSDDPDERDQVAYYDNKVIRGRSKAQVSSDFAKEINKNITDALNEKWDRRQVDLIGGDYEIDIDGIYEYGDSQPVSIVVDPNTHKVKALWWI